MVDCELSHRSKEYIYMKLWAYELQGCCLDTQIYDTKQRGTEQNKQR